MLQNTPVELTEINLYVTRKKKTTCILGYQNCVKDLQAQIISMSRQKRTKRVEELLAQLAVFFNYRYIFTKKLLGISKETVLANYQKYILYESVGSPL